MEEELRQAGSCEEKLRRDGSCEEKLRRDGSCEEKLRQAGSCEEKAGQDASRDLADVIRSSMRLPQKDWSQYSPLALAWIGDTVYDLIVRSVLLSRGMTHPDRLHRQASEIVNARAQAAAMKRIRVRLTESERSVCRRGHNAKPAHKAKNASMDDYLDATAFECLMGYLYLTGKYERILELIGEEPGIK